MKLSAEQLKELRSLCNDSTAWASVLDELIAIRELKCDQVPYGYYSAETSTILEQQGHANITKTLGGNWQFPLFTAPQKPVVCLKSGYLHKSEVIDAIEAAGCVVSFSDERLMQDMSGIVKDGE